MAITVKESGGLVLGEQEAEALLRILSQLADDDYERLGVAACDAEKGWAIYDALSKAAGRSLGFIGPVTHCESQLPRVQ